MKILPGQHFVTIVGPLGLAHCLMYVELSPFGSVSREDRKLMQLKTVLKSRWTPSFGNFTIYSSPRVIHLVANAVQLGLRVTGQEVPQKLV
jgi:hypothetical protein